MAKQNKPAIRFKGFTDAWEQRKAKELCNIGTGKSNTQDQVEDGIYPFYIRSDIPVKSNKYLYDCEAVITIGDGNIGRVFHYVNGKFDLHQRCYKMTDFQDIWGKYFYYFFSTRFYDRAMKMTAKATVDSVRLEMISEMDIWKPTAIDEQKKIAEFFANLDHLITLHQRKYDKLQVLKKAMLEKMFPKNGSSVPEIRFKGFTDAWEQRKVGEVSESYSGGTPSVGVKEYYGGQIPFIRSAEINSEITELFLTEEGLKNSSAQLVAVGDILYALYGATSGEVGRARLKGAINQAILAIKPHTDYDSEYLAQWLRKSKHSIIETYLQGGQGNLSGTIVKELSVDFPSLKEQKAIGGFFRQLDNLITLHQRELEKLQNIKKSMLEKMFV